MMCCRAFVIAALLWLVAVVPGRAADVPGSVQPQHFSGNYSVTLRAKETGSLRPGTSLVCKVRVAPVLPAPGGSHAQPASEVAVGSGSPQFCALQLPYSWSSVSVPDRVSLVYEIDAVSTEGRLIRRPGSIVVPRPPAGGTANLSFSVSF